MDTVLTQSTLVPIGVAIGGIIAISSLIWRVSAKTSEVLARLDSIERKLDDHWTRQDQFEWVAEFRMENPGLKVPMPRHERSEA
jgi:hypothetical protein